MKSVIRLAALLALMSSDAGADEIVNATLFKNPSCACCDAYADYLRSNGFRVSVIEQPNMSLIKQKYGVRKDLKGCHSTVIGDYVVEGHVPVAPIKRLLMEKPAIKGISLPDMPQGSPGMSGSKESPFEVLSITGDDKPAAVYATE